MTMERIAEMWEKKWLVLAESKHWLFLLFCIVVFAVSNRASSRAANIDNVHQDITAGQTRILCTAAMLHCAGDL